MTVPVPLTDIDVERFQACGITPSEIRALCEALRIAVEQGAHDPNCNVDIVACDCWLAAVRELVDLGEGTTDGE